LPETFIDNLRTTPDLDHNRITVAANVTKVQDGDLLEITVRDQGLTVTSAKAVATVPAELFINDPILWTPDTPHLCDMEVSLLRNGKVIDKVTSYFAMRKISTSRDENGHVRLQLNNKNLIDWQRANVQGEFGGIGRVIEGHLWEPDRNWGYVQLSTSEAATDLYVEYIQTLKKLIGTGFSGAVYTQTTDVEVEVNGIMTYDRKVIKMDIDRVREANREVVRYFD